MKRDPNCQRCPLHETAEFVCLLGQGPEPCDAMIIGEAPGEREDDSGRPFVGRAGRLLDQILEEVGLSRRKVFITNAVSCRPPNNRTPKAKEIDACKHWLNYQLKHVQPKYIMLLGNVPLQAMLGLKGIRKLRGRPVEHNGYIVLPTYHPSYILRGEGRERGVLEQDFRTFKDIIDFGGIPHERQLNVTTVDTWSKVDSLIDALNGVVSCDIETTCLYPWAPRANIVTLGFGTRAGEFSIPFYHEESPWSIKERHDIIKRIDTKINDCMLVFQGGKFDLLWLHHFYNVTWHNHFDTLIAHHLLDENSPHDLEFLAKTHFGAHPWDIPLSEKQGQASYDTIARYHGHDLYYTRRLYFQLIKQLREEPHVHKLFTRLMMPIANLFVRIEHHGCYIDTKKMDEVEEHLLTKITESKKRLDKWGEINWGSPKQVAQLLYGKLKIKCPMKTKKGAPSTAESALNMIEHPVINDLIEHRGAKQQHSFFIEGWKPYIVNRRIHPSFKLHGTVTGRPSCEHPNFQQVPRDPLIRSLVTAPPGFTLMEADLSQIELRIVAELSRVPSMVEAFTTGLDIHWKTALGELERYAGQRDLVIETARLARQLKSSPSYSDAIEILREIGPDIAADINPLWKEMRKKAKAVGFGYVYGMWWKKFKVYARDNYGLHLTDKEAQESRLAYFQLYPLEKWHEKQKYRARDDGQVRNLVGRVRRLPNAQLAEDTYDRAEAWRQAINSPVQGLASDLNLMTLLQLSQEFSHDVFKPVCTVHDSILAEVRNDHVERISHRAEEIMRGPALLDLFNVKLSVPICGETKFGAWGIGVSLDKWRKKNA